MQKANKELPVSLAHQANKVTIDGAKSNIGQTGMPSDAGPQGPPGLNGIVDANVEAGSGGDSDNLVPKDLR